MSHSTYYFCKKGCGKMNIENYVNLLKAYKDDPEDLKFIQERMIKPLNYVNSVVKEAIDTPALKERYWDDTSLFQYNVMRLDKARRLAHEDCISAVSQLNRLCETQNLSLIFQGDINDRYAVADFAIDAVRTFYESNQSKTRNLVRQYFYSFFYIDNIIE